MSRSRPFIDPVTSEEWWFDMKAPATAEQLELLADWEDIELDDLLDEGLAQRAVLFRLRQVATPEVIPEHVLERRRERERIGRMSPSCRICSLQEWESGGVVECEGRITRHHFVPRWLMLELENYQAYASRSVCTIPVCVGRHRDLHMRNDSDKSIVPYLRSHERRFAQRLLDELDEQHPQIVKLMAAGDFHSYEYQLIRDWEQGSFLKDEDVYSIEEYPVGVLDVSSAQAGG